MNGDVPYFHRLADFQQFLRARCPEVEAGLSELSVREAIKVVAERIGHQPPIDAESIKEYANSMIESLTIYISKRKPA